MRCKKFYKFPLYLGKLQGSPLYGIIWVIIACITLISILFILLDVCNPISFSITPLSPAFECNWGPKTSAKKLLTNFRHIKSSGSYGIIRNSGYKRDQFHCYLFVEIYWKKLFSIMSIPF